MARHQEEVVAHFRRILLLTSDNRPRNLALTAVEALLPWSERTDPYVIPCRIWLRGPNMPISNLYFLSGRPLLR